jgi:hypothetical protein
MAYLSVYFYRSVEVSYDRAQEESRSGASIITKLGKLMVLPSVQPTIAMVKDANLLHQRSPFFSKAQKGDAIVIYPDKIIIFDVSEGKIVDIGQNKNKNTVNEP